MSINYKKRYEDYLKKSEVVISQLRTDRDKLQAVFNKIKTEIESIEEYATNDGQSFWLRTPEEIKKDVFAILDKYKAEIESQESEG